MARAREVHGVGAITARVLAARDVGTEFLEPRREHLHDPGTMKGMAEGLDRLERALADREAVRLVTDYDVDGTMSCVVLHAALERRGHGSISYHQPDRFTEGYGLSTQAVEAAAKDGVRVIVTADIGVRDHASVSLARARGIDVVVVDHHLPAGEDVPADAAAVLCPPQDGCAYPNKALAACGVALKLSAALLKDDPRRDAVLDSMLKLVAIGTVADVVDLSTRENRAIVSLGLRALNAGPHAPGLAALLKVAGARPGEVTAGTLGWLLGPRINAAGRLKDAGMVVRLLRERDVVKADELAQALDAMNRERQEIQGRLVDTVISGLPATAPPFVLVAGNESDGFHRGVVGIVAAKVRERTNRPTAIAAIAGPTATASVRSVPAVHAVRALDAAADLLVRYGGHAAAAGFTVQASKLEALRDRLCDFVSAHHDDESLRVVEEVDAVIAGRDVTSALARELQRLEPTGKGNPAARVVVEGEVSSVRVVKDRHVFFNIDGAPAAWWNAADRVGWLREGRVAVLGEVERDTYGGKDGARIKVEDVG